MNELPSTGSLRLRKDLWDRHVANIAARWKEMYGEGRFRCSKVRFLREINAFSPQFYHRWIKINLIQGRCKFWLELPRNMI